LSQSRSDKAARIVLTALGAVASLAVIGAIGYVVVKVLPEELAHTTGLTPADQSAERGRIRTGLVALTAGAVAVIGAYFTARTFQLSRRGQNTDRFARAIEHLGHKSVDVRVGGIYALEDLARDSRAHRDQVIEVLVAYVREHSPWPPRDADAEATPPPAAVDVRAVIKVLARRDTTRDPERALRLDLGSTNLREVLAAGLSLRGGRLWRARLDGAILPSADLTGANLVGARFDDASLRDATLDGAALTAASLRDADLEGVQYDSKTKWDGAVYSDGTTWPTDEFDPVAVGAVHADAVESDEVGNSSTDA
jgi:hypothetical protein